MSAGKGARQSFDEFRPTKTLWFWSTTGAVVVAIVLGFTVGGWVTGGTAQEMAEDAREDGRAQLASAICVERFVGSPDFAVNLAALKEESSYARDNYLEDAGWVTPAGLKEPIDGAADLCADKLADMTAPKTGGEAAAGPTEG